MNYINELEVINGELWANVFLEKIIVVIDLVTFEVKKVFDLSKIFEHAQNIHKSVHEVVFNGNQVLNGIAYDHGRGILLITGKGWPVIYELEINK